MGHYFTYRTDLKKKLLTFLKVLNSCLWHIFINLIDTCIGIFILKNSFEKYINKLSIKLDKMLNSLVLKIHYL